MRIGKHSGGILSKDVFAAFAQSGIDVMEISIGNDRARHEGLPFGEIRTLAEAFGVELWSYHLPFGWFNIATLDAEKRKQVVAFHGEIIRRAREIGIRHFVVHPSAEPNPTAERPERIKACKESLVHMAEIARQNDAVIAVEDLPRTCLGNCSDELLELVGVDDDLRICFDTNHLLGEDILSFIDKVGHRIVTTHVSDYDFIDERHWLPGEGSLDWQAVYKALLATGYKGPWLYEVGLDTPVKTLHRARRLTYADYVRNAREIFAGKPLTVIGTPHPGLGMNVW